MHGRKRRPASGSGESYETDGCGWNISGRVSSGTWNVGWTVSKHMRHVLGGQCLAGFGAVLRCRAYDSDSEVRTSSSRARFSWNAPGIEGVACFLDMTGGEPMPLGQLHSELGVKPVEAISKAGGQWDRFYPGSLALRALTKRNRVMEAAMGIDVQHLISPSRR